MSTAVKEKIKEEKQEVKNTNTRDVSVDFIRIIACLTVILIHLGLQIYNVFDVQVDWSRLFEKSFFTDGVPLFFMITGFFIVNGRSYKKIWKSTIKKVLIPTLIFTIFSQVFCLFILNKESFMYCLKAFNMNLPGIWNAILKADVSGLNGICDHLWYIFSYVKIVIWIPILWLMCKETDEAKLARRIALVFGILSCILIDVQRFVTLPIGEITLLTLVPRELIYVLLGYEMYVHKEKLKNKKVTIAALVLYVITNVLRYRIEMSYMIINHFYEIINRENFMEWKYTSINIFSAVFLFAFLYSIELKNKKLNDILVWISNKTFGIYLIHYLILAKVDLYKFEMFGKALHEGIYLLSGLVLTFGCSLVIVTLIQKIVELFSCTYKRLFTKKVLEK